MARSRPSAASVFERPFASVCDPDAPDSYAGLDVLALRCCEPGADEIGEHPVLKALGEHNCFTDTERAACKELKCPTLFRAETILSRGLPILGQLYRLDPALGGSDNRRPPVPC
jgi:hypothetical protein